MRRIVLFVLLFVHASVGAADKHPNILLITVDDTHMVSAVDLAPIILDLVGAKHPDGFDGRSFEPLLRGGKQSGRDFVFKVYNENAGGGRHPMRGIQTKDHLYLYNPWADGTNKFRTATTGTASYRTMVKVAKTNPAAGPAYTAVKQAEATARRGNRRKGKNKNKNANNKGGRKTPK